MDELELILDKKKREVLINEKLERLKKNEPKPANKEAINVCGQDPYLALCGTGN